MVQAKINRELASLGADLTSIYVNECYICYVRQCLLITLGCLRVQHHVLFLLFVLSALQYTMLTFRFPSLCTLRQSRRNNVTKRYNY